MTIAAFLIKELEKEGASTLKTLARVDFEKGDWKPHEKSMGFLTLATHVADLCSWPARIIKSDILDFATEDLSRPEIKSAEELAAYAEANLKQTREALESWDESDYETLWTLKVKDQVLMQLPKVMAIRFICQNHIIHHRAQLSVYLRLLDIPVPAIYGPSADESH
ncbi:MAG: hypothetical protein BGO09_06440 [Bacteroidetes bacterium 47-18]|mgnify:CR=1 FL=1|nr:MAG: hypothetical protein BGO09_06440 [Bacteroidetes bacterium 47-18]